MTTCLSLRGVPLSISYSFFRRAEAEWLEAAVHPGRNVPPASCSPTTASSSRRRGSRSRRASAASSRPTASASPTARRSSSPSAPSFVTLGSGTRPFEVARVEYRGDLLRFRLEVSDSGPGGMEAMSRVWPQPGGRGHGRAGRAGGGAERRATPRRAAPQRARGRRRARGEDADHLQLPEADAAQAVGRARDRDGGDERAVEDHRSGDRGDARLVLLLLDREATLASAGEIGADALERDDRARCDGLEREGAVAAGDRAGRVEAGEQRLARRRRVGGGAAADAGDGEQRAESLVDPQHRGRLDRHGQQHRLTAHPAGALGAGGRSAQPAVAALDDAGPRTAAPPGDRGGSRRCGRLCTTSPRAAHRGEEPPRRARLRPGARQARRARRAPRRAPRGGRARATPDWTWPKRASVVSPAGVAVVMASPAARASRGRGPSRGACARRTPPGPGPRRAR